MHISFKKFIQYFVALLMVSFSNETLQAQFFKMVVPVGFNFTQVDGDDLAGYNKIGFQAGIGTMLVLDELERFETGFEILYSQLGSNTNSRSPNQIKLAFDYASIPIYFNYKDQGQGYIGTGLVINRLVDQRRYENGEELAFVDPVKNMGYDVMGQIGYLFNPNIRLTLRASYSLVQFGIDQRLQHNYITLRIDTILNGLLKRRKKSGFSR